jgi:START domain
MKRFYILIFLISCAFLSVNAQDGWVLMQQSNGIKQYTRAVHQAKINELKVELTLEAKLSEIASLLLDIDNYSKWSRNLKTSYILKQVSSDELYFYTEVNSPWPANNRDLVVHLKIMQDSQTKVMTIREVGVPNYIPPKKDIVRVPYSNETWTIAPLDPSHLQITYYLQIDPGGGVPTWLVNLFAAKAPLESFKYLATLVQQPKYQQSAIAFIKN